MITQDAINVAMPGGVLGSIGGFFATVAIVIVGIVVAIIGLCDLHMWFIMREAREKEKRKQEQEEQDKLVYKAKLRDDEKLSLNYMQGHSQSIVQMLEALLITTDNWLETAEREFEERAFAPFWNAAEQAADLLGTYYAQIRKLKDLVADHERRRACLSNEVAALSIPDSCIPDARPAATRLSQLGRRAQKDFQFATIYEQRKTNTLLHSGFGTLAAGLERMQYAITDALDDLSLTLGTKLDDLLAVTTSQAEVFNEFSDATSKHFKDSDRETKKQSEMLDNIQRGKKPPEGILDRVLHYRPDGDTKIPHDVSADD